MLILQQVRWSPLVTSDFQGPTVKQKTSPTRTKYVKPLSLKGVMRKTFQGKGHIYTLGIQSPKLRVGMEPKYLSEEVIIHPNHHLKR